MKADTFIKLLRKVVREEVQQVVREELGLLLEAPSPKQTVEPIKKVPQKQHSMIESIKPSQNYTNNGILNDILNETANGGDWKSLVNANSSMAQGFNGGASLNEETTVVNSVDQMLAATRPSGDINAVQIDVVPDFSGIMKAMKEKGQI